MINSFDLFIDIRDNLRSAVNKLDILLTHGYVEDFTEDEILVLLTVANSLSANQKEL